ncbi:hypothetical protein G5I_02179 [Acromyrmex echinatior]|uniref:Uncharacterized protein n=1 Tax=Acromyrmex echinatior TaxID=103372 RepID=F4W9M5_ACREC|nr:hypothetical protein G5I_02179 [Acromyrmex echinatior]
MLLPEVRLILQRQTRSNRSHSEISRILEEEEEADKKKEKETSWSVHCAIDESCPGLPEEPNEPSRFMFVRAVMALTPREVSSKAKPSAIFPSQRQFSRLPFLIWLWPPAVQKPIARLDIEGTISKGIRD